MIDKEKLKQAQAGDLCAIEEICAATWVIIYRYIYFKVQNREEAEDITQETYVKALRSLQNNDLNNMQYEHYLKTIALNILRDRWRQKQRRGTAVNIDNIDPSISAGDDQTEISNQRAIIQNALQKLNAEQRKVIDLRILQGYSVADTAKLMGKKEVTIRVLQYRALQTLADILNNAIE